MTASEIPRSEAMPPPDGESAPLRGASAWEEGLYRYLTDHLNAESSLVDEYRALASGDTSPAFRYLAGWILEDERRHHRVFAELAETLRRMVELNPSEGPIPGLEGLAGDRDRILATTERFLQIERHDARELRKLARRLKDVRDTSLWVLLVRLMQDDTAKHIRILEFIRERARDPLH